VDDLAFSPDGTHLVTGSRDKLGRIWSLVDRDAPAVELPGHLAWVSGVAYSPDGTLVATSSWDLTVQLWSSTTGERISRVNLADPKYPIGPLGPLWRVAFSPDSARLAVATTNGHVVILDAHAVGTVLRSWIAHDGNANAIAYSPDGTRLVTAGDDQKVKLWDDQALSPVLMLPLTGRVNAVSFDPNGTRLAAGGEDRQVHVFELKLSALVKQACGYLVRPNLAEDVPRLGC
jgi:WD40 repeat protein